MKYKTELFVLVQKEPKVGEHLSLLPNVMILNQRFYLLKIGVINLWGLFTKYTYFLNLEIKDKKAEDVAIKLGCTKLQLDVHAFDRTLDKSSLYSWYSEKGYIRASSNSERMEKTISSK